MSDTPSVAPDPIAAPAKKESPKTEYPYPEGSNSFLAMSTHSVGGNLVSVGIVRWTGFDKTTSLNTYQKSNYVLTFNRKKLVKKLEDKYERRILKILDDKVKIEPTRLVEILKFILEDKTIRVVVMNDLVKDLQALDTLFQSVCKTSFSKFAGLDREPLRCLDIHSYETASILISSPDHWELTAVSSRAQSGMIQVSSEKKTPIKMTGLFSSDAVADAVCRRVLHIQHVTQKLRRHLLGETQPEPQPQPVVLPE